MTVRIRLAQTREDVARCFEVMLELRPRFVRDSFVDQVLRDCGTVLGVEMSGWEAAAH